MFEAAMACAFLCYSLRRGALALGAAVAAAVALITVAGMSLLMNGSQDLNQFEKFAVVGVGAACLLFWSAVLTRCTMQRSRHQSLLRGAAMLFQLALCAAAALALSLFFELKYQDYVHRVILPRPAIFVSIFGGIMTGAVLIWAALLGVNELSHWKERGLDSDDDGLLRAGRLVCGGAGLRAFWMVSSILIGAFFDPMGLPTFFGMTRLETIGTIGTRVVIGVILPFTYGLLVLASVREHRRRQAAIQFAPIALLIFLGELLGAGLTVGMWGLFL